MKKEYIKPDVEIISLVSEEAITTGDGIPDGGMGYGSSEL